MGRAQITGKRHESRDLEGFTIYQAPPANPRWRCADPRRRRQLYACLGELMPEEQRVLYLRFWKQLEIAEIAKRLSKSWEYVNGLIEAALRRLRAQLMTETS